MKQRLFITFLTGIFFLKLSAQQTTITGPAGSENFGSSITVLTNGNYVVADRLYDEGATLNVGAVYLYNGNTHALISVLKGSTANDQIGSGGIVVLTNGNFVVVSSVWDNGAITNAGAVTWCSGATGLTAVVSSSNSLVGSNVNDNVGASGVIALSNGHYVVCSSSWNNGATADVGAVTWCDGTTGLAGAVSSSNSLIGGTASDVVGAYGIVGLSNGNYVVRSPFWRNGAIMNAGAVTWCNGTTGRTGTVSSANSLVGSTAEDQVGASEVIALGNGHYVVLIQTWDNGAVVDAGAVTWCNGTTGRTGSISSSNSLVGSTTGQFLGANGITMLTNGHYVVPNPGWDNGAVPDAGAATWCNGTTGRTGTISSSNSLVGTTSGDMGNLIVVPLSNGNYVVVNTNWDNGAITDVGAVTWCNGTTGRTGTVSSSNSLVGSTAFDIVGAGGATALSNGHYVVNSYAWDNGAINSAGASTWCDGTSGRTGTISSSNSLVGSSTDDNVGVTTVALPNGNYVVISSAWNNGAIIDAGAVTWGNGTSGITGTISSSNSLLGSVNSDRVGNPGIVVLTNGNYVVRTSNWDNGAITNVGAITWCDGTLGLSGLVSSSNSLVGATSSDQIGSSGVLALTNGNYVISSSNFDNGSLVNAGAVTWCDGSTGRTGVVNSSNSLVGGITSDAVGTVIAQNSGNYIVNSSSWDNGTLVNAGAVTFGNGLAGVTGLINSCNSILGTVAPAATSVVYNPVYGYSLVGRFRENRVIAVTSIAGTPTLATHLQSVSAGVSGTSPVSLIAGNGCNIIAMIQPAGASPVTGNVNARTWIESSVPTYAGQPFVARHYEITPVTNPSTATGRVTLYFSQQEFTDFNNHASSLLDLPTGPADLSGIANLRVGKYAGTSSNGTGLPGTYSGAASVIDPADNDIVWNAAQSRWEISFDVSGFSGFVVQTSSFTLPLTLLDFNGKLLNADAQLSWRTENELNSHSFDIERSADGRQYTKVGTVRAMNMAGIQQYQFLDRAVLSTGQSFIFYRLKQIDIDGRFSYSRIVLLNTGKKYQMQVFPNPARDLANIAIQAARTETVQIMVKDPAGRTLISRQQVLRNGDNLLQLDISRLSTGTYLVEVTGTEIQIVNRLVVQ